MIQAIQTVGIFAPSHTISADIGVGMTFPAVTSCSCSHRGAINNACYKHVQPKGSCAYNLPNRAFQSASAVPSVNKRYRRVTRSAEVPLAAAAKGCKDADHAAQGCKNADHAAQGCKNADHAAQGCKNAGHHAALRECGAGVLAAGLSCAIMVISADMALAVQTPGHIWTIPPSTPLIIPPSRHTPPTAPSAPLLGSETSGSSNDLPLASPASPLDTPASPPVTLSTPPAPFDNDMSILPFSDATSFQGSPEEPPSTSTMVPGTPRYTPVAPSAPLPDPGMSKYLPDMPPFPDEFTRKDVIPPDQPYGMPNEYVNPPPRPRTTFTAPAVPGLTAEDLQPQNLASRLHDDIATIAELAEDTSLLSNVAPDVYQKLHYFMTEIVPQLQAQLAEQHDDSKDSGGVGVMPIIQSRLSKLKAEVVPSVVDQLQEERKDVQHAQRNIQVLLRDLTALVDDLTAYSNGQ